LANRSRTSPSGGDPLKSTDRPAGHEVAGPWEDEISYAGKGDTPLSRTIIPAAFVVPSPSSVLVSRLGSDTEYLQADPVDEKGCIMVASRGGVGVWAAEHTVQRTENMHGPQRTSREVNRPPSLRQNPRIKSSVGSCCRVAALLRSWRERSEAAPRGESI